MSQDPFKSKLLSMTLMSALKTYKLSPVEEKTIKMLYVMSEIFHNEKILHRKYGKWGGSINIWELHALATMARKCLEGEKLLPAQVSKLKDIYEQAREKDILAVAEIREKMNKELERDIS